MLVYLSLSFNITLCVFGQCTCTAIGLLEWYEEEEEEREKMNTQKKTEIPMNI